jgi:hypothetical protein
MAEKSIPGMQFADWTTLPSITETMARQQAGGAKSPLMMLAGKLIEQFNSPDQAPVGAVVPTDMGMGQGLSTGSRSGVAPNTSLNTMGAPSYQMFNQQIPTNPIANPAPNYQMTAPQAAPTTVPSLGQPTTQPTDSYTKYLFAPR